MRIKSDIEKTIFKAYDIRGKYPTEIDKDVAYTIGKSYGSVLQMKGKTKCIVGGDNRFSSLDLSLSLILGILSTGTDVINLGLVTTPMCLYAKEVLQCPSYIMVTASHNPKDDNGFKFSFDESGNVRGREIEDFYNFTLKAEFKQGVGNYSRYNIRNDYLSLFRRDIHLGNRKLKVVLDLANGTTSCIARSVFEMFNLDLTIINEKSDPNFPNHHPDPIVFENQQQLIQKVLELNADIGIGFDGDGDRCGVVDNEGNVVKTDTYMAILVPSILQSSPDKRILYDVKCSNTLRNEIIKWGGSPICYRTGASYTMSKVIDDAIRFGGEYSGHIYFNDRSTTIGSGIYAALRMIEVLSQSTKSLSDYTKLLDGYFSTPEIKIESTNERKQRVIEDIKKYCIKMRFKIDEIDGVKIIKDDNWGLIRASNTGPHITARFEATSPEKLFSLKRELLNLISYYNKD